MPIRLDPVRRGTNYLTSLPNVNYNYDYPNRRDLRPGSVLHDRLLTEVLTRAQEARDQISRRYDSWNEIDRTLTAYMYTDEKEKKEKEKDPRKPTSVVVPISYATLETLLTYLVAAFLNDPIFRYEGRGPEDVVGATLLEMVVDAQVRKNKMGLALHTLWRDSLAYGIGIAAPIWETVQGYKTIKNSSNIVSSFTNMLNILVGRGGSQSKRIPSILFEGNTLENIDPYMFLPDPNVPIQKLQKAEFIGWCTHSSIMELLEEESMDDTMFNANYVKHIAGNSTLFGHDKSDRKREGSAINLTTTTHPIDVIYMYINLIPRDWKLGSATTPEKWLFAVAGDQVVLRAQPLNLDHNMYPVVACSPDYDGYTMTPISRLEVIYGLQETIDFLYNSHIKNVRKAINDMFIVDPEMININDMLHPEAGMLARLRKKAWGRGVTGAIEQLKVSDVTRQHMSDALYVSDIVQKVSAATDSLAGIAHYTGERRTAEEMRGTRNSALSRLEKSARIASMQCMSDLSYILASQTQQLMSQEQYYKIIGTWEDVLREESGQNNRILINPIDILVDYDVIAHDGTIPSAGDPEQWMQMMQIVGTQPTLQAQLDIVKIFKHWARMTGAKNVNDFQIQTKVMPDNQVQNQVQQGNLISVGGL